MAHDMASDVAMFTVSMPIIQFHGRYYSLFVSEDVFGAVDAQDRRPVFPNHDDAVVSKLFMPANAGQATAIAQFIQLNWHVLSQTTCDYNLTNIASGHRMAGDFADLTHDNYTAHIQEGRQLDNGEQPTQYHQDYCYITIYNTAFRNRIRTVRFRQIAVPGQREGAARARPDRRDGQTNATPAARSTHGAAKSGRSTKNGPSSSFHAHLENMESELAGLKLRLLK